jgi:hypothetical protein
MERKRQNLPVIEGPLVKRIDFRLARLTVTNIEGTNLKVVQGPDRMHGLAWCGPALVPCHSGVMKETRESERFVQSCLTFQMKACSAKPLENLKQAKPDRVSES